jgi:uncharacterized phage protein gp47/JayE
MTYQAPSIDSSGLHINSFTDILAYYTSNAQAIFGSSVYLGNDAADYQQLAIIATIAADCNSGLQLVYNSFGAQSAIGAGQDALYKLNGIKRKVPTYSTCPTGLVTGTAGAVITGGKVTDPAGNTWDLPSPVTIGGGGTVIVTVTCETSGAINAAAGTISNIATPTYGWTSFTNTGPATPGQPTEADSAFRARQTVSTGIASNSPLNGVQADIANLTGVERNIVYENPTNSTGTDPNGFGLPAHSITAVVEGSATSAAIANAIWSKKTPGAYTNGSTTTNITDQYGNITPISYYTLGYTPIYAIVNVHVINTTAYTAAVQAAIQTAVANYLNSLAIGQSVLNDALNAVAMMANPNINSPIFTVRSVYSGIAPSPTGTADITIAYNYASQGAVANISLASVS